jgi:MYXO-CTERM domain-containing protein
MSQRVGLGLASCFVLALSGCAVEDGRGDERTVSSREAIKGGYDAPAETSVVAAHHCVADTVNSNPSIPEGSVVCGQTVFGPPDPASSFYVTTGPEMVYDPNAYRRAVELSLPSEYASFCGNDQAILILESNVPDTEAKPLVPRVDTEIAPGEQYYAVGFGAIDDNGYGSGTRRRRDDLFISCVSSECPSYYVASTEWEGDEGICQGDSGGPAIDMKNRVIGVTSRGAAGCLEPVYGYVYGWAQWIKDQAIHAADVGGYPAPAWAYGGPTDPDLTPPPIGGACTAPSDCESNGCYDGYCTRACGDLLPACDAGFLCTGTDPATSFCVKDEPPPPPDDEDDDDEGGNAADPTGDDGGCSMGADPTKPVPWFTGAAVVAFALLRRRRR